MFWLIGRSWPLQSAQPLGAKLKGKILISATNGSHGYPSPLGLRGEDPLQSDDEVEHQIGRHVVMRLVAAGSGDAGRVHGGVGDSGIAPGNMAPQVSAGAGGSWLD